MNSGQLHFVWHVFKHLFGGFLLHDIVLGVFKQVLLDIIILNLRHWIDLISTILTALSLVDQWRYRRVWCQCRHLLIGLNYIIQILILRWLTSLVFDGARRGSWRRRRLLQIPCVSSMYQFTPTINLLKLQTISLFSNLVLGLMKLIQLGCSHLILYKVCSFLNQCWLRWFYNHLWHRCLFVESLQDRLLIAVGWLWHRWPRCYCRIGVFLQPYVFWFGGVFRDEWLGDALVAIFKLQTMPLLHPLQLIQLGLHDLFLDLPGQLNIFRYDMLIHLFQIYRFQVFWQCLLCW